MAKEAKASLTRKDVEESRRLLAEKAKTALTREDVEEFRRLLREEPERMEKRMGEIAHLMALAKSRKCCCVHGT